MNFSKISKKYKNVIIILLIGTIFIPYFSTFNIAKADDISDYKTAITNASCREFYANNCTYSDILGDGLAQRKATLDSWAKNINKTSDIDIYNQYSQLNGACVSLEDLSYDDYHAKVDPLFLNDATRICMSFLNITEPIKDVNQQTDESGELDRCPVETVQAFSF